MDKVNHKSKDILGGNVEKIAELFPGVITEAQDEATGEVKKAIDFDLLRQHLSDELVEGDRERFRLDWPGKKASILKANTPITKTLRPVREDSVDFDTTQNVFIEGDNFEVLKVLQESYLGKIKMIYIDPPYNTGKDFIYRDNFAADREDYEQEIGVRDDENGGKLVKNTETNGRYHSDWLSMMQERLIVARDLLTDNGVIFISIDDNEQAALKKLCDEVFGENNFVEAFFWNSIFRPSNMSQRVRSNAEYVICYARSQENLPEFVERIQDTKGDASLTKNQNKVRALRFPANTVLSNLDDGVYPAGEFGDVVLHDDIISKNGVIENEFSISGHFAVSQEYLESEIEKGIELRIKTKSFIPYYRKVYQQTTMKPTKLLPKDLVGDVLQSNADIAKLFDTKYFDYPKPLSLIKFLVNLMPNAKDAIILDFFSGSSTTAHAVMQLNAEDGGNRKHIQVQLAEPTDEKSEAYKAGYKTIPEISRERIRRAGKKIRETHAEQIAKRDTPLDTGFRAYKLSSSNFVDTAQHPNETTQVSLLDTADNIKEGRSAEDLLTETILDLGLTLDLPIETRDIAGHTVYFVGGNSLVACFDDKVSLDIVDGIAAEKPLRVVFKDSSFKDDQTRINIDIRLKQLSPDTTVQVV